MLVTEPFGPSAAVVFVRLRARCRSARRRRQAGYGTEHATASGRRTDVITVTINSPEARFHTGSRAGVGQRVGILKMVSAVRSRWN
jgi:hypothetical protein